VALRMEKRVRMMDRQGCGINLIKNGKLIV
jgi:hypothetical protein